MKVLVHLWYHTHSEYKRFKTSNDAYDFIRSLGDSLDDFDMWNED